MSRPFQFRLRTMFWLTAVAGVLCVVVPAGLRLLVVCELATLVAIGFFEVIGSARASDDAPSGTN